MTFGNILLVGGNTKLHAHIIRVLKCERFNVDILSNKMECLKYLEHTIPDLIILDIKMTGMVGIKTLKQIREKYTILPIIILSERADPCDQVSVLTMGADDYITKPFDDRELVARIRARLRRQVVNLEVITIHNLTLDSRRLTASFEGEWISLTHTEFSLLHYMAIRQGQTISRTELNKIALPGKVNIEFSRNVDMHISHIRKKLPKREGGIPWIQTIRGAGYRFLK